jgi:two-component system LytT family response regulator
VIRLDAVFNHPEEALRQIKALQLDVLFLDVEMPGMNGFRFLEKLGEFDFEVIFTTAYNTYTLEALRLSVVDYLVKPVDEDDLETAIIRLQKRVKEKQRFKELGNERPATSRRLALPTAEGIYFIEKSAITHVEAMSNYSTFHTTHNKKVIVSKTLKEYEEILCDEQFLRVSRSAIVNLNFVVKYRKGEGGSLEMMDGKEIEVAPSKKEMLVERLMMG